MTLAGRTEKNGATGTGAGINAGEGAPVFVLPDEEGWPFDLHAELEKGPLVLVFYRGDW